MVDCENPVRLDAYHDGELSPAERSAVEAHLRDCPSCAAELAAIRGMSAAFASATPHEPLLALARSVRAEPPDARMLLRLFRVTAVAASVLLACALAAGTHLSHQAREAAHEAIVLDHVAVRSGPAAFATGPAGAEQQVLLAQWIADDLRGRPEDR